MEASPYTPFTCFLHAFACFCMLLHAFCMPLACFVNAFCMPLHTLCMLLYALCMPFACLLHILHVLHAFFCTCIICKVKNKNVQIWSAQMYKSFICHAWANRASIILYTFLNLVSLCLYLSLSLSLSLCRSLFLSLPSCLSFFRYVDVDSTHVYIYVLMCRYFQI